MEQLGTRFRTLFFVERPIEYGKNIPNYYYDNLMDTIAQYEKIGLGKSFYHRRYQS